MSLPWRGTTISTGRRELNLRKTRVQGGDNHCWLQHGVRRRATLIIGRTILDMSTTHPECRDPETGDGSVAANCLVAGDLEEDDEEEEEEEEDGKDEDEDAEDEEERYSVSGPVKNRAISAGFSRSSEPTRESVLRQNSGGPWNE